MAFWNSEKLKQRLSTIVTPYDETRVKSCAYELLLGPEAFITSERSKKTPIPLGGTLSIPPGQFGLLLTEERVAIPDDAIGFISIKASIKFRGLVNVSGFHVDPGFKGRLKFSVYNAGGQNIVLSRSKPVFILWLADLNHATKDLYDGDHNDQMDISSNDIMLIQGEVASPAALKKQIDRLNHRLDLLKLSVRLWFGITIGLFIAILGGIFLPSIRSALDRLLPASRTSSTQSAPAPQSAREETHSPSNVPPKAPGTAGSTNDRAEVPNDH